LADTGPLPPLSPYPRLGDGYKMGRLAATPTAGDFREQLPLFPHES
jgi:hypothetical protein